jgi:hypothetical protein
MLNIRSDGPTGGRWKGSARLAPSTAYGPSRPRDSFLLGGSPWVTCGISLAPEHQNPGLQIMPVVTLLGTHHIDHTFLGEPFNFRLEPTGGPDVL